MKDLDLNDIDLQALDGQLNHAEKEKTLEELIAPYVVHWKWFVFSVIIALIAAFIYLRYVDKVYQVNSTIILKDKNDQKIRGGDAIFSGMDLMGTVNNVDNEVEVLKSKSIIKGTVNALKLHTSYIVTGRIKSKDLYTESPLQVTMEQSDLDQLKTPVSLTAVIHRDQSVTITRIVNEQEKKVKLTRLPVLYSTPYGNLTFSFRAGKKPQYDTPIEIAIKPPLSVVSDFRAELSVAPTSKTTSVLNLQFLTSEPQKGTDFLNELVNVYNRDAIADKNREALNTKDFIDGRIASIDSELGSAERSVEQYKKSQGLTDLQTDVQLSVQKGSEYEQKLVEVSTQLNMVDYLANYVNTPANRNKLVPSNVGIDDPTLVATINEYNKNMLERDRLLRSNTESNPVIQKLEGQISSLRDAISTSIASVKQGLNIARRDAQNQVNLYRGQTGMAPTQERQFTEISRQQQIKASLFLMLLQKREENALTLSASANSARVLDEATVSGPVKPKRSIVMMAAFMLGLLIPAAIIFLKDLLHYKIDSRSDVEKLTNLSMLGEIPVSKAGNIAVRENENGETEEAFRMLRTNLLFTLGKERKVVIVTSTEPKEGKTFISINTAITLALLGKKVLLIGLDLRLPRLSEYMNINSSRGMSQYLSGYETDIRALIQPSGINPNLSVIAAGTIPPNPAELIARTEFDKAIDLLKQDYDYIVIDSAPTSAVTDTIVAGRVADATIFVCRANYSHKNNLLFANELNDKNMLPAMSLVVNGVTNYHSGYGKPYGFGYGYGYGYGHGKEKEKKKWYNLRSFFRS
ncbi:MAG: GumC family protein [Paludibacteraceae bacterium]